MPLSDFRFPARHRHRFVGDAQLCADQAGGGRQRRPHRPGQSRRRNWNAPFAPPASSPTISSSPPISTARWRPASRRSSRPTATRARRCAIAARLAVRSARRRGARRPAWPTIAGVSTSRPATSSRVRANRPPRCISSWRAASASSSICREGRTHARAQPGPTHDRRRNGPDHRPAAQRDHPGRDRQRAL